MELFIIFVIATIIFVVVMAWRNSSEGKRPDRAFHRGLSSDHNDLISSDPNSIAHAQFIYHQAGFGSSDRHSAFDSSAPANTEPAYNQPTYDSCAPREAAPGDFGGGNCSDSGGSFDSGGSCSPDGGSGSY
jgi:hypothetical protein